MHQVSAKETLGSWPEEERQREKFQMAQLCAWDTTQECTFKREKE